MENKQKGYENKIQTNEETTNLKRRWYYEKKFKTNKFQYHTLFS